MLYLIEQGVLSVADTDVAVSYGPGLRWGVMGQSLQWHLGGGEGGIKHFMDHLMDPLVGMMNAHDPIMIGKMALRSMPRNPNKMRLGA